MRAKIFSLLFALALTAVLSLTFASALSLTVDPATVTRTVASNAGSVQFSFNVTNTPTGVPGTVALSNVPGTGSVSSVTFNPASGFNMIEGARQEVLVTVNFPSGQTGSITGTIEVDPSTPSANTQTVSYTISLTNSQVSLSFTQNPLIAGRNTTLTLQNTAGTAFNGVNFVVTGPYSIQFNPTSLDIPANGQVSTLVTPTGFNSLRFGEHTATVTAQNSAGVIATNTLRLQKTFCRAGSVGGNLTISNVDLDDNEDEEDEWTLRDTVTVEVEVDNNGNDDIDDVQVEIGLFDSAGNNVINDMEFSNSDEEQVEVGDLGDGDEETVEFEFDVPSDFDTGNYRLAIKAFSDDLGEARECVDTSTDIDNTFFEAITVDQEDDEERFIIVDDIELPSEAVCGESVTGSFTVFNVGEDDQDQVLVTMTNRELGLSQEFELREDLDTGDDHTFDFNFNVPTNARDGIYQIGFQTFYDYDNGDYDQESEDTFTAPLRLIGCANTGGETGNNDIRVDAELASDAMAGEELSVDITIRNTGDEQRTIFLDVDGYQDWADLGDISEDRLVLEAGESETITITFDVNEDVSDEQSFSLVTTSNGVSDEQEVQVEFAEASSGGFSFGNPSTLWLIAAINIILIVLIIIVAVRVARR